MGHEVTCKARIDGRTSDAKALLETDEIVVRGDERILIPLRKIRSIEVRGGSLQLQWDGHEASLDLGDSVARKWLDKIRNPRSLLDKLGMKPGLRVSVIAVDDPPFHEELAARGADVSTRARRDSDAIFFGANRNSDLSRLAKLKESLAPAGALWVVRPKGTKAITEAATLAAGKEAGLVDIKVVKFSETHTAEKFVIPVAKR